MDSCKSHASRAFPRGRRSAFRSPHPLFAPFPIEFKLFSNLLLVAPKYLVIPCHPLFILPTTSRYHGSKLPPRQILPSLFYFTVHLMWFSALERLTFFFFSPRLLIADVFPLTTGGNQHFHYYHIVAPPPISCSCPYSSLCQQHRL